MGLSEKNNLVEKMNKKYQFPITVTSYTISIVLIILAIIFHDASDAWMYGFAGLHTYWMTRFAFNQTSRT